MRNEGEIKVKRTYTHIFPTYTIIIIIKKMYQHNPKYSNISSIPIIIKHSSTYTNMTQHTQHKPTYPNIQNNNYEKNTEKEAART